MVTFDEQNPQDVIANPKDTTLLGWLKLNQHDPDAHECKYHEIQEHYVWNSGKHMWTPRKQVRCIGRMYTANPSQGERHYLRTLLHHIPGAICFNDLITDSNGVVHRTFKEAALSYGLLESDIECECMSEAALSFMPRQLHSLFVTILLFGDPTKTRCFVGQVQRKYG